MVYPTATMAAADIGRKNAIAAKKGELSIGLETSPKMIATTMLRCSTFATKERWFTNKPQTTPRPSNTKAEVRT